MVSIWVVHRTHIHLATHAIQLDLAPFFYLSIPYHCSHTTQYSLWNCKKNNEVKKSNTHYDAVLEHPLIPPSPSHWS